MTKKQQIGHLKNRRPRKMLLPSQRGFGYPQRRLGRRFVLSEEIFCIFLDFLIDILLSKTKIHTSVEPFPD